jgi:hypothetical protein
MRMASSMPFLLSLPPIPRSLLFVIPYLSCGISGKLVMIIASRDELGHLFRYTR